MLMDMSVLRDIYMKDDDSCYVNMLIVFYALHYLCHFDHEFLGCIQPCCYICGVRHGLTLVISSQEEY